MSYMEIKEVLANKLKEYRKRIAVSQEEFAEMSDVSVCTIRQIEIKKGNPTIEVLTRFAKTLNIPLKDLFN